MITMSEEEPNQMNQMYYTNEKDAETVKFLLSQETEIQRKIMYYQGYDFNFEKQKYIKTDRRLLLNADGVEFVSRSFRRFLNKNSATANISFEQLSEIIICYSSEVRQTLINNMRNYEIISINTIMEIKNDITDMAFLILTQSIDDKGREFIHQGRRTVESRIIGSSTQKEKSKLGWW